MSENNVGSLPCSMSCTNCVSLVAELDSGALPLQGAGTPHRYWTSGGVLVIALVSAGYLEPFSQRGQGGRGGSLTPDCERKGYPWTGCWYTPIHVNGEMIWRGERT